MRVGSETSARWVGLAAACLAVAVGVAGCGNVSPSAGNKSATVRMKVTGGNFSGNSLRVEGVRSATVDPKYRCENTVDFCTDLFGSNPVAETNSLCPSNDLPNGTWTFTYTLYDGPGCTGAVINQWDADAGVSPTNFECYDSHDLLTQANVNQTVAETLEAGLNENSIACLTYNATKSFAFSSCAVTNTLPLTLDCGCTWDGGCGCDALSASNLQSGCSIEGDAGVGCSIICQ